MPERGLGRLPPSDDRHLQRYPLTAPSMPAKPTPVVLGINWYTDMDDPVERDGAYWITPTGTIRGGHAICVEPPTLLDVDSHWGWYNQGNEGACVGYAISRMMSLLNRRRYVAEALYRAAQKVDEWGGENYSGTSVRAGLDVAREQGLWRPVKSRQLVGRGPFLQDGIVVNRWARSVEEVAACLSPKDNGKQVLNAGYVTLLNSWGNHPNDGYPHRVRLSLEHLNLLAFRENGEVSVVTDR